MNNLWLHKVGPKVAKARSSLLKNPPPEDYVPEGTGITYVYDAETDKVSIRKNDDLIYTLYGN